MLAKWTRILPYCIVEQMALKQCQKNTLGGLSGVWAYRNAFIVCIAETEPTYPVTPQPDAGLADLKANKKDQQRRTNEQS